MKRIITLLLLTSLSTLAFADDERGFFVGGGAAATVNGDCSWCDSSGYVVEAGYNFNKNIGIEAKSSSTEFDDIYGDLEMTYLGVNIGTTFNSSWARLYGKLGYADTTVKEPGYTDGSDSNVAFGIGVVFTPFAHQSGLYIKIESIRTEYLDSDVGAGQISFGFQF